MNQKNHSFYFAIIIGLVVIFTSSCARYSAQPLKTLSAQTPSNQKPHVAMAYKVFDKNDCKQYLGGNIIKKGYQPIQITINNNSDHTLSISPKSISIPAVSSKTVAIEAQKKVSIPTVIGCSIAGFATAISLASHSPLKFFAIDLLTTISLEIPFIFNAQKANRKMEKDFIVKELHDQIIAPQQSINSIVFVPTQLFNQEFSVVLIDEKTNERYILSTSTPYTSII